MSLTENQLKALKPKGKSYKIADERGLYVEVSPTGGKLWRYRYRVGKIEKKLSIGTYPDLSLKEARHAALEARMVVANGGDPALDKRKQKIRAEFIAGNTFEEVAREYIDQMMVRNGKADATVVKANYFLAQLVPAIGNRPLAQIEPYEVLAALKRLEAKGKHETAKKTRSFASRVFRFGVATTRCTSGPTSLLKGALITPKPKHYAAILDPKELDGLLRAIDDYTGYLQDAFHDLCIDELNEEHVTRWFAEVNRQSGPGAANMALGLLNLMLNKAEDWGYRLENTNPCRVVRTNRRNHFERFLSLEELQRLGAVLAKERASDQPLRALAAKAITLLALTGCRRGEILGLHWKDIHGTRLKLRYGKTGPRMVWMGGETRAVLDTRPRYDKVPWVFWNPVGKKAVTDIHRFWSEFRADAGLSDFRLHDLRHNFASHAAMNKETLPMIGRLLGHVCIQSTSRYAHLDDGHALEAAEQIGDPRRLVGN